ncbi:hypothetical protein BDN72DRAFT_959235 [Pluteus cervinus]|uniref:Uncharacterized protein n=1 Tax=Pluteus cervinus TaxID=181527 RepID=A0ACD3AVQ0_9AGAR|nr:hypothetical protein BDN72DRAFT_959235 [Pluteus cervinus]
MQVFLMKRKGPSSSGNQCGDRPEKRQRKGNQKVTPIDIDDDDGDIALGDVAMIRPPLHNSFAAFALPKPNASALEAEPHSIDEGSTSSSSPSTEAECSTPPKTTPELFKNSSPGANDAESPALPKAAPVPTTPSASRLSPPSSPLSSPEPIARPTRQPEIVAAAVQILAQPLPTIEMESSSTAVKSKKKKKQPTQPRTSTTRATRASTVLTEPAKEPLIDPTSISPPNLEITPTTTAAQKPKSARKKRS